MQGASLTSTYRSLGNQRTRHRDRHRGALRGRGAISQLSARIVSPACERAVRPACAGEELTRRPARDTASERSNLNRPEAVRRTPVANLLVRVAPPAERGRGPGARAGVITAGGDVADIRRDLHGDAMIRRSSIADLTITISAPAPHGVVAFASTDMKSPGTDSCYAGDSRHELRSRVVKERA
jgi:hypothetical protein